MLLPCVKVKAEFEFDKELHTAKTLLGLSSVFVKPPPLAVKLLPFPDWSVTLESSLNINHPFVP